MCYEVNNKKTYFVLRLHPAESSKTKHTPTTKLEPRRGLKSKKKRTRIRCGKNHRNTTKADRDQDPRIVHRATRAGTIFLSFSKLTREKATFFKRRGGGSSFDEQSKTRKGKKNKNGGSRALQLCVVENLWGSECHCGHCK